METGSRGYSVSATDAGPAVETSLGPDIATMSLQGVVPRHHWQASRSRGDWSLVSCVVAPGFTFDGFDLAPPDFDIPTLRSSSIRRRRGSAT